MTTRLKKDCITCGGTMIRDTRTSHHIYKKQTMSFEQPGWYCQECPEIILESDDMRVSEEIYANFKASIDHLLTPTQIQEIRKKSLAISQREAGRLLGGGERSFQRYESGKIMISQPMNNLLIILKNHPELLHELRSR